eukprot:Em0015g384a
MRIKMQLLSGCTYFASRPNHRSCNRLHHRYADSTCSKNACFTHDGGDFLKLSRKASAYTTPVFVWNSFPCVLVHFRVSYGRPHVS